MNEETLDFAYERNILNEWEMKFYYNILKKRKLSPKQEAVKIRLNNKLVSKILAR